jgi:integrase
LHTRDLDEANRKKWATIAAIKAEFSRLEGRGGAPEWKRAAVHRAQIRRLLDEGRHEEAGVIEEFATEDAVQIERDTGSGERAEDYLRVATTDDKTLGTRLVEWLEGSSYGEQTRRQHRVAFSELQKFSLGGHDTFPDRVTDSVAVRFVESWLKLDSGHAVKTQRGKLASLSSFWSWMGLRGYVPRSVNPWLGFKLKRGSEVRKRAFSDGELVKLFSFTPPTAPGLGHLMIMGLLTGARIDELASLRVADVQAREDPHGAYWWVSIVRSKTRAGIRNIAVAHAHCCAVLHERTAGKTADALLFHEFVPRGYNNKLSHLPSKQFGRHMNKVGLTDAALDFHGFRRTLATCLENAGVDPVRIARYLGHALPTLALSLYSGGSSERTSVETARAIRYPPAVEAAVQGFLGRPVMLSPRATA